jgi:hypothetical protein
MNSDMYAINCFNITFKKGVKPLIIKYSRNKKGIRIRKINKSRIKDQEHIKYLVEDPIIY